MPPSELTRFNEASRGPRFNYPAYEPRRDTIDREQYARISAQLMKAKNELDDERAKGLRMRKTIEEEHQQKFDAASSAMLTSLIREQADAITAKARFEAKERELNFREQKIQQLEVFLSEGQKHLVCALEKNGDQPMNAIQTEHIRREATVTAKKSLADLEAKLATQIEQLSLRAQAQNTREQCYKTLVRESVLAELNASTISEDKAKEIAELGYKNGFAAGKEAGRKEMTEQNNQRGFLEGYRVSRNTQILLSKMRKGVISRDSPELDFLYDADHPYNPCTMGERLGQMEHKRVDKEAPKLIVKCEDTVVKKSVMNGRANGTIENQPEEPVLKQVLLLFINCNIY